VIVSGGLGNQLYAYALAHLLAQTLDAKIKLTYVIDSQSREDRPIELFPFLSECSHNISVDVNNKFGKFLLVIDKFRSLGIFSSTTINKAFRILELDTNSGSPALGQLKIMLDGKPRVVRGFIQSFEIAEAAWPLIEGEISETLGRVIKHSDFARKRNYCALHIRRGDTVTFGNRHGILSLEYYKKYSHDFDDVTICFDDQAYASQLAKEFPNAELVGPNESTALETLAILINGTLLVAANSTLSWWAAFISGKIGRTKSILPFPWNKQTSVSDTSIHLASATYERALFEQL
jgi:hypothetical protein